MMIRQLIQLALVWLFLAAPQATLAQAELSPAPALVAVGDDAASWERLAARAEALAQLETISVFAISRLRAELVVWRDIFLQQSDLNAGRLATVNAQIAALGPLPDDGIEPDAITARRSALDDLRAQLLAPRLLAQESYARANGLIGELDNRIVQRQTAALFERGPAPVDPTLF
ncbi:MAG: DUF3772 domain-containing protein, partial [Paracoccaceae bacterium]|nr:DUF3772 domain-containing protein [Paracoccaceae bacterium]